MNKVLKFAGFVPSEEDLGKSVSAVSLVILESKHCQDKVNFKELAINYCSVILDEFSISTKMTGENQNNQALNLRSERFEPALEAIYENFKISFEGSHPELDSVPYLMIVSLQDHQKSILSRESVQQTKETSSIKVAFAAAVANSLSNRLVGPQEET